MLTKFSRISRLNYYFAAGLMLIGLAGLAGCNNGSGFAQPDIVNPSGFTVSGTTTGLSGSGLTVELNGANPLSVSGSAFTFSARVAPNSAYAVTIQNQPSGQVCTVNNGTGAHITGNVSNVVIVCNANTVSVSGTVTGLPSGGQVKLTDNGGDALTVTANAAFTFPTPIALGSNYEVAVSVQPTGYTCTVSNGSGSNVSAAITNVAVSCSGGPFVVLYSFGASTANAYGPYDGVPTMASDGNFYGNTANGGANGTGAIFRLTPLGVETLLYSFTTTGATDGFYPYGSGLTVGPDGALYGTTYEEGPHGCGTLFRITTSGQFSVFYSFGASGTDACYPYGGVIVGSDGNFYGLTYEGGSHGYGTIYKITSGGTETVLHSFGGAGDGKSPEFTTLVEDGSGNFYGVTPGGGANSDGVAFKYAANGTYSILHSFGSSASDGTEPFSTLTFGTDGNLYGVTYQGGTAGYGVMFKLTTSGTFTLLHTFAGGPNDGTNPYGQPLVLGNDGNFYGASYEGGLYSSGTLYKATPDGTITILHSFRNIATDGAYPYSGIMISSDGYIYGFADEGGAYSKGVFYRY